MSCFPACSSGTSTTPAKAMPKPTALVTTLYPASQAAAIYPAEALRYE